jgi:hypothetical protein
MKESIVNFILKILRKMKTLIKSILSNGKYNFDTKFQNMIQKNNHS